MRTVLVCFLGALACVGAYGLYWQHRLAPLMDDPAARLEPEPMTVHTPKAVRHVDLGFAAFDLPARIRGDVIQQGKSQFFAVTDPQNSHEGVTICPLISTTAEVQSLIDQFAGLNGWRPRSYWEIEKAALFTKPFSVWQIPFRGRRRAIADATLLTIKGLMASGTASIEFYETDRIGAFITTRADLAFITIADKVHGTEQRFLVAPASDAEEIASTLVQTYQVKTDDYSAANLLTLAARIGIQRRNLPEAGSGNGVDAASESVRLQHIAEEVEKRRAAKPATVEKVEPSK